MRLVITADEGRASATFFVRVPLFLDNAAHCFSNLVEFFDVAIRYPATLQGLDSATFKNEASRLVLYPTRPA